MKIALLAGSNRKQATSTMLLRYIETQLDNLGHDVSFFDLYEKPIPFYSPDIEEYGNSSLLEMKTNIKQAEAIVLSTSEYHGSITGVLKNALDHLGSDHFDSKTVLAVSSAGGPVGVSSLTQLQVMIRNVHGINCPEWISLGYGQHGFKEDGTPDHQGTQTRTLKTLHYFLSMAEKLTK